MCLFTKWIRVVFCFFILVSIVDKSIYINSSKKNVKKAKAKKKKQAEKKKKKQKKSMEKRNKKKREQEKKRKKEREKKNKRAKQKKKVEQQQQQKKRKQSQEQKNKQAKQKKKVEKGQAEKKKRQQKKQNHNSKHSNGHENKQQKKAALKSGKPGQKQGFGESKADCNTNGSLNQNNMPDKDGVEITGADNAAGDSSSVKKVPDDSSVVQLEEEGIQSGHKEISGNNTNSDLSSDEKKRNKSRPNATKELANIRTGDGLKVKKNKKVKSKKSRNKEEANKQSSDGAYEKQGKNGRVIDVVPRDKDGKPLTKEQIKERRLERKAAKKFKKQVAKERKTLRTGQNGADQQGKVVSSGDGISFGKSPNNRKATSGKKFDKNGKEIDVVPRDENGNPLTKEQVKDRRIKRREDNKKRKNEAGLNKSGNKAPNNLLAGKGESLGGKGKQGKDSSGADNKTNSLKKNDVADSSTIKQNKQGGEQVSQKAFACERELPGSNNVDDGGCGRAIDNMAKKRFTDTTDENGNYHNGYDEVNHGYPSDLIMQERVTPFNESSDFVASNSGIPYIGIQPSYISGDHVDHRTETGNGYNRAKDITVNKEDIGCDYEEQTFQQQQQQLPTSFIDSQGKDDKDLSVDSWVVGDIEQVDDRMGLYQEALLEDGGGRAVQDDQDGSIARVTCYDDEVNDDSSGFLNWHSDGDNQLGELNEDCDDTQDDLGELVAERDDEYFVDPLVLRESDNENEFNEIFVNIDDVTDDNSVLRSSNSPKNYEYGKPGYEGRNKKRFLSYDEIDLSQEIERVEESVNELMAGEKYDSQTESCFSFTEVKNDLVDEEPVDIDEFSTTSDAGFVGRNTYSHRKAPCLRGCKQRKFLDYVFASYCFDLYLQFYSGYAVAVQLGGEVLFDGLRYIQASGVISCYAKDWILARYGLKFRLFKERDLGLDLVLFSVVKLGYLYILFEVDSSYRLRVGFSSFDNSFVGGYYVLV